MRTSIATHRHASNWKKHFLTKFMEKGTSAWSVSDESWHQCDVFFRFKSIGDIFEGYIFCFNCNMCYAFYALLLAIYDLARTALDTQYCDARVALECTGSIFIVSFAIVSLQLALTWSRRLAVCSGALLCSLLGISSAVAVVTYLSGAQDFWSMSNCVGDVAWWLSNAAYYFVWSRWLFLADERDIEEGLREARDMRKRRRSISRFPSWVRNLMFIDVFNSCFFYLDERREQPYGKCSDETPAHAITVGAADVDKATAQC